VTSAYSLP